MLGAKTSAVNAISSQGTHAGPLSGGGFSATSSPADVWRVPPVFAITGHRMSRPDQRRHPPRQAMVAAVREELLLVPIRASVAGVDPLRRHACPDQLQPNRFAQVHKSL